MACFIVPATEAIVVTAVTKIAEKKQEKKETDLKEESGITLLDKAKWLRNLLWGGSGLLAFEHLWHGEISPEFPFLTAMGNSENVAEMLHEMSTVGVGMAVIVTAAWGFMVFTTGRMKKKEAVK